jgi:hypothetical protein
MGRSNYVIRELDAMVDELYGVAEDGRTFMSLPRVVQAWAYRSEAGS